MRSGTSPRLSLPQLPTRRFSQKKKVPLKSPDETGAFLVNDCFRRARCRRGVGTGRAGRSAPSRLRKCEGAAKAEHGCQGYHSEFHGHCPLVRAKTTAATNSSFQKTYGNCYDGRALRPTRDEWFDAAVAKGFFPTSARLGLAGLRRASVPAKLPIMKTGSAFWSVPMTHIRRFGHQGFCEPAEARRHTASTGLHRKS
jgi:hypothetical protein